MKTSKQTLVKLGAIRLALIAFLVPLQFLVSNISFAVPINYDINYDDTTGTTTIFNSPTSEDDLQFSALSGDQAFELFYLAPGNTVNVDKNGHIIGPHKTLGRKSINKHPATTGGIISVLPGFIGEIVVAGKGYSFLDHTPPLTIPVNKGNHVRIRGTPGKVEFNFDAIMTSTTEDLLFIFDSPDWLNQDQVNVELLSGGLQSADNSDNFVSIFTPDGATTGCIPEPSTVLLLTVGAIAYGFAQDKRGKA